MYKVELDATHYIVDWRCNNDRFCTLAKKIDDSGMPMATIARRSGIRRETLYNRLKGVGEFTASEITALSKVLGINKTERENIFFAKEVALNATR